MRTSGILSTCILTLVSSFVQGATIRHDRPDNSYRHLGRKFDAVGLVDGPGYYGSGTLIAPNLVLTAAHVANTDLRFTIGKQQYRSKRVTVHPDWNGNLGAGNDLAVFELDRPVTGVKPVSLFRSNAAGRDATLVGFGGTGTGVTGTTTYDRRVRGANNVVDGSLGSKVHLIDFDSPRSTKWNEQGSAKPVRNEGLSSFGDSGGGLFVKDGTSWKLTGVTSFLYFGDRPGSLSADYGDRAGYVNVTSHLPWIDSFLRGNGQWNMRIVAPMLSDSRFVPLTAVPEPSGLGLLLTGLAMLGATRRIGQPIHK